MSQEEKQPVPVSVVALRAESYSTDDGNIVISLQTRYSTAERKYSVPVRCLRDLVVDLHRLNTSKPSERASKASNKAEPLLPFEMPVAAE